MSNNEENGKKLNILIHHAIDTNKRLDSIDANLDRHMKRTALLEDRHEEMKPMLEHFKGFKWALGALTAVTLGIKILEFFKHGI